MNKSVHTRGILFYNEIMAEILNTVSKQYHFPFKYSETSMFPMIFPMFCLIATLASGFDLE